MALRKVLSTHVPEIYLENLTPYMIKFVDYGLRFMQNLQIPMCRFSTEGGEHSNYMRNCFYYNHTTQHGGKKLFDPLFAQFSHMEAIVL